MARLSWETIRRSLGLPEPDTASGRGRAREGQDRNHRGRAKGLDMEAAAAPADGVSVAQLPAAGGQRVTVTYAGPLARRGAKSIYVHYGYGPGDWRDVQEMPMTPVGPQRFQASLPVQDMGRLEFCFRDDDGNWDNNGGRNWSCTIHPGGGSSA